MGKLTQTQIVILAALALVDCLVVAGLGAVVVTQTLRVAPTPPTEIPAASPVLAQATATLAATAPSTQAPPTWTPVPTALSSDGRPAGFVYDYCPFTVPEGVEVDCGFIDVPETHGGDPEKTIRLAVAVYHSGAEDPAPDPVLYLSGGPGGGAVEPIATVYETFIAPILATRDFVVFDQRGTGHSNPALTCPDYIAVPMNRVERNFRANSDAAERYVNELLDCHDWLVRRDIDVAAYTSAASAADINTIVEVLGYTQINLYGGSYGTRLAQTVMRDFPHIVRSAVLDSAVPIELELYNEQAAKTAYALKTLFDGCAADPACNAAYPNLQQVYYDLIARLDAAPILVRALDPKTGFPFYVQIDGVELTGIIFFGLQLTDYIPYLPRLIYDIANDDYVMLSDLLSVPLDTEDVINIGMFLSVNCHEEIFATTPEQIEADYALYPETEAFARASLMGSAETYEDLCRQWGAAPFDPREGEPLTSAIPTLIIAGEYDSATPPTFGKQIAENLTTSYFFEFPGHGHVASITTAGCPFEVALAFLEGPWREPDAACLADMGPPVFFVE